MPKFYLSNECLVRDAVFEAESYLENANAYFGHGTDNAWDESVMLLLWALGADQDPGTEILDQALAPEPKQRFVAAVNRRGHERIPAAYITGEAWFCGHKFHVDERVIVPRSPIAELIQNEYRPWVVDRPTSILDLCCGSGCIGIAAAILDNQAKVTISDLSMDALEVAAINVERHGVQDRVKICQSDLFTELQAEKFDLILSNPPYVDAKDLGSIPMEYRAEPELALGSGPDGLDLSRRILREAAGHLNDQGVLVLEVGNSSEHLERLFPDFPFTWISFANGGDGVCVLTKQELVEGPFS